MKQVHYSEEDWETRRKTTSLPDIAVYVVCYSIAARGTDVAPFSNPPPPPQVKLKSKFLSEGNGQTALTSPPQLIRLLSDHIQIRAKK